MRTARRCSSSTAAAWPSVWRERSTSLPASRWCARTMARSRAPRAARSKTSSRPVESRRSSPPRRSSSVSTWAPSILSSRSRRRHRSPAAFSASDDPGIRRARSAKASSFRNSAATSSPAPTVARAMHDGLVESTRYPRNPLDVLAQQIVAMAAMDTWDVDALFARIRCAAPYADLSLRMFEGVLDMLSGRYPSDEFAELRPRITWDRVRGTIAGREGAKRVAIANAGTIPDRGLYGVFLAGADRPVRVGELDEEMVFETQVGETFTLGASTWRIEEITHDRVLVSPAPGEPGKMPFWHGDQRGPSRRTGLRDRQAGSRSARHAAAGRDRSPGCASTISTPWPPKTCFATSTIRPHPAPSPTTGRSSSSAASTSSATGASACCRRSAAGSTRHGRWPSPRTSAIAPAWTSK